MITSIPEGHFVHWKGMKLSDLLEDENRLSVFNRLPTEGYAQDGKFWVRRRRDQELEGVRNTRLR
jgi:hypothetical protein